MIPNLGIVIDAGTAMFRVRDLIETPELNIFLSHVHLDHCIGLTFLFDVLHEKNVDKVRVFAEKEKITALQEHLFAKPLFPVMPEIEFVEHKPSVEFSGYRLQTFPLKHPGGSLGFRFDFDNNTSDSKKSLAYVTDTTAKKNADYIEKIQNADLLIHECYFADGLDDRADLTGHSCLTPVCHVAASSQAGQLALVHINPLDEDATTLDLDAGKKIYPNLIIPDDLQTLEF